MRGIDLTTEKGIVIVRVNKIYLVFLRTIATALGFTPAILVIGRPNLMILVVVGAFIVAAYSIRSFETLATEKPEFLEFILGGLGEIYFPSFMSFNWLSIYWLIFWAIRLFDYIGVMFHFDVPLDPKLLAYNWALFSAVIYGGLTSVMGGNNLAKQLYPQTAGIKSAFYELSRELIGIGTLQLIIKIIKNLIIPVAYFIVLIRTPETVSTLLFSIGLIIYLFLGTANLSTAIASGGEITTVTSEKTITAIGNLFDVSGYKIYPYPRTGRSEIDPLLIGLDLYVQDKKRAFAIDVQTLSDSSEFDAQETLSKLFTAAWALEGFFQGENGEVESFIDPMVVFVGFVPGTEMRDILKLEGVHTIEVSDFDVVDNILKADKQEKEEMASYYLGVYAAGEGLGVPYDNFKVSGGIRDE